MSKTKPLVDPDAEVELGEAVDVNPKTARTRGAVMAVRLSPDLLARVTAYAAARDMTISEVMRRGVEQLVSGHLQPPNVVYHTGAVLVGPGIVHGSPVSGTGQSLRNEDLNEGVPESLTR